MSSNTLVSFAAATLVLLIIPGPAVMYIVTRSAVQGRQAGLISVAGIHVGTVVHVVAAMIGLSAILAASATAFSIVKLVGAAYLMWLGVESLRNYRLGAARDAAEVVDIRPLQRVFADGVVLNILNPKTAIFFLSFVPQFVDPSRGHAVRDVAVLGAVFILLGIVSDSGFALAGGWIGGRLRRSKKLQRRKDAVAGVTYLGLGAATAFSGHRAS